MDIKRFFFGMEIVAPWPEEFPAGRVLLETDRHLTLAFLGETHLPTLQEILPTFPKPPFAIGLAGYFDRPVFLPHRSPHVAAWHVSWLEKKELFLQFQKEIVHWLQNNGIAIREKKGEFLSHVTIARRPFSIHEWKASFQKLPVFARNLHLCESLGSSRYEVCWQYPILAPFEEIEHTADIAFLVRGENFSELLLHAQLALSFHFSPLLDYFSSEEMFSLDEVIAGLNRMIAKLDQERGSPFKAVSFHGNLRKTEILEWEMVVDV